MEWQSLGLSRRNLRECRQLTTYIFFYIFCFIDQKTFVTSHACLLLISKESIVSWNPLHEANISTLANKNKNERCLKAHIGDWIIKIHKRAPQENESGFVASLLRPLRDASMFPLCGGKGEIQGDRHYLRDCDHLFLLFFFSFNLSLHVNIHFSELKEEGCCILALKILRRCFYVCNKMYYPSYCVLEHAADWTLELLPVKRRLNAAWKMMNNNSENRLLNIY